MNRIIFTLTFFALMTAKTIAQFEIPETNQKLPYSANEWVDSVLNSLTLEEKIAQLMNVVAVCNEKADNTEVVKKIVQDFNIGGLILASGDLEREIDLINQCQEVAKTPLLISMDAEWGLGMRFDSTISFPFQMALGAITNDTIIYEMGKEIARQCKRIGVHTNFAPVVDVNNNPANPIINYRSFGENVSNVCRKSFAYAKGMQDNGVLPVIKHFPGHGDTQTDSHYELPVIPYQRSRLDSVELYPFQKLIDWGIGGIMSAHLSIPALDERPNLASSLSERIVTDLLRKEMGFNGIVFSDAIGMKAVSRYYKSGKAEVQAIKAGNDVVLMVEDIESAIKKVKKAVWWRKIDEAEIDEHCRRVLAVKHWCGLHKPSFIDKKNIISDLNPPEAHLLHRTLVEKSLTLLQNRNNILPVKNLGKNRIASVSIGRKNVTVFQETLSRYTKVTHFNIPKKCPKEIADSMLAELKNFDIVIVGIHKIWMKPQNRIFNVGVEDDIRESQLGFGLTKEMKTFVKNIISSNKVIVSYFGNPYSIDKIMEVSKADALLVAYQESVPSQDLAAQLIFGGIGASGKLPVSINKTYPAGTGIETNAGMRFKYTMPEEIGINSKKLHQKIDSVVKYAMEKKAFPGCQILIAKERKIIFHKTYGFHTYFQRNPVRKTDIYDFASVTKITGPLPALMKLHSEGKIDLDEKFSKYWTGFQNTNKAGITFREVLAHYARLIPWIPFWKKTIDEKGYFKKGIFAVAPSEEYPYEVTKHLFIHKNYRDTIYEAINQSELLPKKEYRYSGVTFYLYPKMIEELTGTYYETYLKEMFYEPLGAYTLTYNAHKYFELARIIPTENDNFFRMSLMQGWVHDEGASMMGGVSGNAGLFGSANDLAKLMQMYMEMGKYGGKRYISEATLKEFTAYQYENAGNRRGLGFDKPVLGNDTLPMNKAYPAPSSSRSSFGHSGYTGTFAWADPENNLLFIFFSNRVHPTRDNPLIYSLNIRPTIHQIIYDLYYSGRDPESHSE